MARPVERPALRAAAMLLRRRNERLTSDGMKRSTAECLSGAESCDGGQRSRRGARVLRVRRRRVNILPESLRADDVPQRKEEQYEADYARSTRTESSKNHEKEPKLLQNES